MAQRLYTWRWLALTSALAAFTLFTYQAGRDIDAAAPLLQAEPVRFIAFGDMGTGDNEQYALAKQMAAWHEAHPFNTVLLLGDNIYPDGDPADLPAKFEKPYAELLRRGIRFQAVLGNHDVKKGRAAQISYANFNMGGKAYYSFVKGPNGAGNTLTEFFALDSNSMDAEQLKWVAGALAASTAAWKLVFFHHPIYSSADTHGSDTALRAKLEPLFVRYGVAAVFSGHDHTYERTKPMMGVQYFVAGAASGKLRHGDLNRKSPFLAFGNDETGSFLYVEVSAEQLSFQAINAAGSVFDKGALTPGAANELALNMPVVVPADLPASTRARMPKPESTPEPEKVKTEPSASKPENVKAEKPAKESKQAAPERSSQTRISPADAQAIALKSVPGTVESSELKRKDGKLIYAIKVRTAKDIAEVRVNAEDGEVVRVKRK